MPPRTNPKPPDHYNQFSDTQRSIYEAFEELGRRVHESGPLTERERRLVKLGIAIGVNTEGAVHSATRFALAGECSPEDIGHAVRLAITTLGWPRAMAAMSWTQDLVGGKAGAGRRGKASSRAGNARRTKRGRGAAR